MYLHNHLNVLNSYDISHLKPDVLILSKIILIVIYLTHRGTLTGTTILVQRGLGQKRGDSILPWAPGLEPDIFRAMQLTYSKPRQLGE